MQNLAPEAASKGRACYRAGRVISLKRSANLDDPRLGPPTEKAPVSQSAPIGTAPAPPSILRAAGVFVLVGPAAGAGLFIIVFAIFGLFSMGLGLFMGSSYFAMGLAALLAPAFYSVWIAPWLYLVLGVPFLLTGIAYAIAARRYARPSLLMALMAGACVFTTSIGLLYLSGWQTTFRGVSIPGADAFTIAQFPKNFGMLIGAMVIGVVPSWWLVRDPGARLRWI